MAHPRPALICALGILLLTPQAAAGGGWMSWIDVSRSSVAPGQHVEVDSEAWFPTAAAAEAAQEPSRFYVYLLREFDYSVVERAWRKASPGDWWSLGAAEAIQVGQVTVSVPQDSNLGRARAEFTVPDLPPATYHLMLCDAGCVNPLATVIPAKGFSVVADPATAQLAQRVGLLERRIRHQAGELNAAHPRADRALDEARNADSDIDQLGARVSSLANEGHTSPLMIALVYAGWFVAGALAGALALLILRRRRSSALPATRVPVWQPSDDELQELVSSEPGRHG